MSILFPQKQAEIRREKCPVCGKLHDVVKPFPEVKVMICQLIPDLIYVDGIVGNLEVREKIKDSLLGN